MFVFSGNDFIVPEQSLESFWGISAVYPRGSLLSSVGLLGINHLITNYRRPILQAWHGSGDLRSQESHRHSVLSQSDDYTIKRLLLSANNFSVKQRNELLKKFNKPKIAQFFKIIRAPDQEKFRSYYLSEALWSAANNGSQWEINSINTTWFWVNKTSQLCKNRGVDFTLVIIPEAFQVDSRMCEQWKPLADMRHLTRPCRVASEELRQKASSAGIDVVDLHEVLDNVPGTYLNLDGHWSDYGVEIVSERLAQEFSSPNRRSPNSPTKPVP